MKIDHNGMLMRIYLAQSTRSGHAQAFQAIVEAMDAAGLAGASVFQGIEGFGAHRYISSVTLVDAFVDLPILIEVVDDEERIRGFIPRLEGILTDGLVTLERVQTIFYRPDAG